jgi:hypothetical protein
MTVADARRLLLRGWSDEAAWRQRLREDAAAIVRDLPMDLLGLHRAVVCRARDAGGRALILTGSTARARRTDISDLDYHLIGPRIDTRDLSREVDVHVLVPDDLERRVLAGDDFIHWSLRFGRIVFDDGIVRQGFRTMAERRTWPDVERKRRQASKSVEWARRIVASGDEDGALVQVRTALSLAARAVLLARGEFPLSRAELPDLLAVAGRATAGRYLRSTIDGSPGLPELEKAVDAARDLLDSAC